MHALTSLLLGVRQGPRWWCAGGTDPLSAAVSVRILFWLKTERNKNLTKKNHNHKDQGKRKQTERESQQHTHDRNGCKGEKMLPLSYREINAAPHTNSMCPAIRMQRTINNSTRDIGMHDHTHCCTIMFARRREDSQRLARRACCGQERFIFSPKVVTTAPDQTARLICGHDIFDR